MLRLLILFAIQRWRHRYIRPRLLRLYGVSHYCEIKVRMYVGREEWALMTKRCWGVWMTVFKYGGGEFAILLIFFDELY